MRFLKSFFIKTLSLSILLFGVLNPAQAQPSLYDSLKDFFSKINSEISPSKFFKSQTTYLSENENSSSIGIKRNPFIITSKNSPLENIKIQGTHPGIAYDPDNQRYLIVWEYINNNGSSTILGQFRDKAGNPLDNPVQISTPRAKRGCFYENFDSDNGAITTPRNCSNSSNPAVAYNKGPDGKGRFLVVWELKGNADFAKNSDGSDNPEGKKFSNIIAKMLNANDLTPAAHPSDQNGATPVWEEGILISGIWIVSNNPANSATNDNEIQAWEQSTLPDVAPSSSNGFVVTWQTNKGFIGCDDSTLRDSSSIYARYIQPEFSPNTGALNKPAFPVYTDPSARLKASDTNQCFLLSNVFRAQKPRIAYNSTNKNIGSSDFQIAYEFARAASATRGDIGVQRVSLDSSNNGSVQNPTFTEYVVKGEGGAVLANPDIISYLDHTVLAYDNHSTISLKSLTLDLQELSSVTLALGDNEGKREPRLSAGFGVASNASNGVDVIALSFIDQNSFSAAILDGNLNIIKGPVNISSAQNSHSAEIATDFSNFVVTWAGTENGIENVKNYKLLSSTKNNSPFTPELAASPANGVVWAPTRLYLSWNQANDPDGEKLVYELYFSEVSSDPKVYPQPTLYRSNLKETKFVIQSSTDGRPEYIPNMGTPALYLEANKSYAWKVCAKDAQGAISICSDPRRFYTDDSVVGWWRFDSDPNLICPAGLGKTGAPGGMAGQGICDYSGNGNHGIVHGGVSWLSPMVGILGRALEFDGISGWVEIPNSPSLNPTNAITLLTQLTLTSPIIGGGGKIISKFDGSLNGYLLDIVPGTFRFGVCSSGMCPGGSFATSTAKGDSYKVIASFDGMSTKLYSNGVLVGEDPKVMRLAVSSQPLLLATYGGSYFLTATSDEMLVLNKSLKLEEVLNDYNSIH